VGQCRLARPGSMQVLISRRSEAGEVRASNSRQSPTSDTTLIRPAIGNLCGLTHSRTVRCVQQAAAPAIRQCIRNHCCRTSPHTGSSYGEKRNTPIAIVVISTFPFSVPLPIVPFATPDTRRSRWNRRRTDYVAASSKWDTPDRLGGGTLKSDISRRRTQIFARGQSFEIFEEHSC
jgi:hypothetical protein